MDEQEKKSYSKRPLWQWLALYLVIALVLYGAFYYLVLSKNKGYNSNSSYNYQTQTPGANSGATPTASPTSNAQTQKFTVTGSEFAFTPSTLTVKSGQLVEITFKNMGKYPHNLTITDLNVSTKTINPGESDTLTFTPTKTGSFGFLCTVPTHADRGMKGTLTVQ